MGRFAEKAGFVGGHYIDQGMDFRLPLFAADQLHIGFYAGNLQRSQTFHKACAHQGFLAGFQADTAPLINEATDFLELFMVQFCCQQAHIRTLSDLASY